MRPEVIRSLLKSKPFRPFTLHLPKKQTFRVHDPEFTLLSPQGDTLISYDADGRFHMLDMKWVSSISLDPPSDGPAAIEPSHVVDRPEQP